MQIACGKLRWEGARQHAGRTGNHANSLGRASLAGNETAFKPWKWLGESSMQSCCCGFVRAVGMFFQDICYHCDCLEKLWVQDVEIAGGELRRERATLKCRAFWHWCSQNNFHQCDCSEKLWVQDVEIAGGELRREGGNSWGRAA